MNDFSPPPGQVAIHIHRVDERVYAVLAPIQEDPIFCSFYGRVLNLDLAVWEEIDKKQRDFEEFKNYLLTL